MAINNNAGVSSTATIYTEKMRNTSVILQLQSPMHALAKVKTIIDITNTHDLRYPTL